jgi:hypothetical protein
MRWLLICCAVGVPWLACQQSRPAFDGAPQQQNAQKPAAEQPNTVNSNVTMMADESLVAAYPKKRGELLFDNGRFSPDGRLFAAVLTGIETGDPEQVWLYDLRSKRLIAVTEQPPQDHETSIRIRDVVWSGDGTLYISAERIHGVAQPFFIAATMNQTRRVDSPPAQIGSAFRQHVGNPSSYDLREQRNDRYVVTVINQGHGDIVLRARPAKGGPTWLIAFGGWELESFLFSGNQSEVLYPTVEGVATVDLQTGKSRLVLRGTGGDLRLLDRSIDGKLIAYTVFGPCLRKPDYSFPVHQPRNVCFARLE